MTRAKEKLYLTSADFYGDGKRAKKISPFVSEALGEIISNKKISQELKKVEYKVKSLSDSKI